MPYVTHRYHQPSDEYRPEMDFRANAHIAQVAFALGWRAAQPSLRIDWLPGDEFEAARSAPSRRTERGFVRLPQLFLLQGRLSYGMLGCKHPSENLFP